VKLVAVISAAKITGCANELRILDLKSSFLDKFTEKGVLR